MHSNMLTTILKVKEVMSSTRRCYHRSSLSKISSNHSCHIKYMSQLKIKISFRGEITIITRVKYTISTTLTNHLRWTIRVQNISISSNNNNIEIRQLYLPKKLLMKKMQRLCSTKQLELLTREI